MEDDYTLCLHDPDIQEAYVTDAHHTKWVVDSGATRHFTGFIGDLQGHMKRWSTPRLVRLPNGGTLEAIGSSDVEIDTTYGKLLLQDLWYTPNFSCRLISTAILNDGGVEVRLKDRRLTALCKGAVVFKGIGRDGLYYVDQPTLDSMNISTIDQPPPSLPDQRELWHNRLGHTSYKYIDKMPTCADGITFPWPRGPTPAGETACESCLAGRMKESFNKTTDSRMDVRLRRLHCDISGI
jgi:hypothetical protein